MPQPVISPVEVIGLARRRAGFMAALDAALLGGWFCLLTALLALLLGRGVGRAWGESLGIVLNLTALFRVRAVLLALIGAGLALTAYRAYRAYRDAGNVERLAAQIDGELNAQQEILTFASLVASHGAQTGASPSALFPILWRRAGEYLASFDPVRRFRLNKRRLLKRGALLAVLWTGALIGALALFSRLERPPYYDEARRLDALADKLDKTDPGAQALARRLHSLATLLTDPSLSDAQKLKQIAALKREMQPRQAREPSPQQPQAGTAGARGSSTGQGSANQSGAGSGENKQGQGQGGEGGKGRGRGEQQAAGAKKDAGLIEQARNELSKTEKQLLADSSSGQRPPTKSSENNPPGQQGQTGGTAQVNPSRAGNQPVRSPGRHNDGAKEPGSQPTQMAGDAKPKPGQGPTNAGAGHGDTRLGETPAPKAYARFYKPGEHGPPLAVKDARYVTVRIPGVAQSGAGGKVVAGAPPSKALTPYANLPLPIGTTAPNPEEQQLVPLRYRDLLH